MTALLDTGSPLVGGEHKSHGAVVLDADPHDRTKAAGLRVYSTLAEPPHESLVKLFSTGRIARPEQARAPAPAHVREQGELGHDQSRPSHVNQAQVHLPRFVGEHAEVDD